MINIIVEKNRKNAKFFLNCLRKETIILGLLIFFHPFSHAQDRVFSLTYQSDVLNKGHFDLEYWNAFKMGKSGANSPYLFGRAIDQRIEFEVGLGHNLQTAFYLNQESLHLIDTSSKQLQSEQKTSFSSEWKLKCTDASYNFIGSALYAELEIGANNIELETKIILDKRWRKDLIALNIISIFEASKEWTGSKISNHWETPIAFNFAYMHFLKPQLGIGLEARNFNAIAQNNGWEYSVWFAGPALHYSNGHFFTNINWMPQLGNTHLTQYAPYRLELIAQERSELRIMAGFSF